MNHKNTLWAASLLLTFNAGIAQASLIDRGSGMLYDNVLGVTWLQDANYAKTSGADADGKMNWTDATSWATDLSYGGYDDWRLASNAPVNGSSFNYSYSPDGTTDIGYNITSPNSELAYMYNVNLGLTDYYDTADNYQSSFWGGSVGWGGQADVGLVENLQSYAYWSGTEYAPYTNDTWNFNTGYGFQDLYTKDEEMYAWAVRPGDVAAAVPEPGIIWLMGCGLLGSLLLGRRQHRVLRHFG